MYADKSIFLGKKFYIDRLVLDNGLIDYHVRAKGLSTDCVKFKAKQLGITPLELYERLFNHERIDFDLCANNAVKFEKLKDDRFAYRTKKEFLRSI